MKSCTIAIAIFTVLGCSATATAQSAADPTTPKSAGGLTTAPGGSAAPAAPSGSAAPGVPAPANSAGTPSAPTQGEAVPEDQVNFLMKAALGGMAEVEMAKLALERSTNADVRGHAQHMLDDHGKANESLKAIAREKNIPLPDHLTGVHGQMVQKLRDTAAGEFDEAYMKAEVEEHQAAVALYRTAKDSSKDPRMQGFAAQTLPTLERHLQQALEITNKISSRS
jgi:putative membrane protein